MWELDSLFYFSLNHDAICCSVHLVELQGTGELYAMKAMEKSVMLNRNKVWITEPWFIY